MGQWDSGTVGDDFVNTENLVLRHTRSSAMNLTALCFVSAAAIELKCKTYRTVNKNGVKNILVKYFLRVSASVDEKTFPKVFG